MITHLIENAFVYIQNDSYYSTMRELFSSTARYVMKTNESMQKYVVEEISVNIREIQPITFQHNKTGDIT